MARRQILGMLDIGDGCYYEASDIESIDPLTDDEMADLDDDVDLVSRLRFRAGYEVFSSIPSDTLADRINALVRMSAGLPTVEVPSR